MASDQPKVHRQATGDRPRTGQQVMANGLPVGHPAAAHGPGKVVLLPVTANLYPMAEPEPIKADSPHGHSRVVKHGKATETEGQKRAENQGANGGQWERHPQPTPAEGPRRESHHSSKTER